MRQEQAVGLATLLVSLLVLWWSYDPTPLLSWLRDLVSFFDPLLWRWWLAIQALAFAVLPLTAVVLRALPLAGYPCDFLTVEEGWSFGWMRSIRSIALMSSGYCPLRKVL
ncbi:hypothetical protein [Candidatus Viridilinea mediisalina]|nr:hypothetical protein [Candidatus Viridilinea mediisalina]